MSWVAERLRPYLGLDIVEHGYLGEAYGGHPVGTPYVDIGAACDMDRDKARRILGAVSGLPELAWECGWRGRVQSDGQQVTQLRLFPPSKSSNAA